MIPFSILMHLESLLSLVTDAAHGRIFSLRTRKKIQIVQTMQHLAKNLRCHINQLAAGTPLFNQAASSQS